MSRAHTRTRYAVPVLLTAALLAARAAAVAPLTDPVSGAVPPGLRLSTPTVYAIFAPLFTLWDGISMLGMTRLGGFLLGCALLYVAWRVVRALRRGTSPHRRASLRREAATLAVSLALFVAFVVAGAFRHRPMLALAGVAPDDIVVDYHSHTNVSRDVRKSPMRDFDLDDNLRWHERAGFDAVFLTEHNEVRDSATLAAAGRASPTDKVPYACPGVEVSAWDAHVLLLGPAPRVSRDAYSRSLDGLLTLLRISDSAHGALSIASLPEYRRSHWGRLDTLVAAGLDGFEIVNAAPKANELSRAERDTVAALARGARRLLLGVSDSHGWGATSMAWNLVRIPGWRGLTAGAEPPCAAILARLRADPASNRIVERHRLRSDDPWPLLLTPLGVVWETWRSMGRPLVLSWLLWIWLPYAVRLSFRPRSPSEP